MTAGDGGRQQVKLVIIGGASAYTPDIVAGLLQQGYFDGWELTLHDPDAAHLDIIARLAQKMARACGTDLTVTATTDLSQALEGARFILTQPRVGGLAARRLDERIPLEHGVIGQETLGAGGFAFAWRTIPVMLEIVAEARRLAPEAWIVNYANPAGMVTAAVVRRFPDARFIGLCDMPTGVQWAIGRLLRVDFHRIALDYTGINHGGWIRRVLLDGQDVTSRLRPWGRLLGAAAQLLPLTEVTATLRLFRQYGHIPDPYLRYYYYQGAVLRRLQRARQTRAEAVMAELPALYRHYEEQAAQERPVLTRHRGHQSHGDLASQVIGAMAAGQRTRFVIQQRNGGTVPNLAAEGVAQFPAWVDGGGWEPIPQPPMRSDLAPLIQHIQQAELLNVQAALEGDRLLAVEAMTLNPLVAQRPLAERLVEALIRAHQRWLPQFQ